jgi:hypothetical protein
MVFYACGQEKGIIYTQVLTVKCTFSSILYNNNKKKGKYNALSGAYTGTGTV